MGQKNPPCVSTSLGLDLDRHVHTLPDPQAHQKAPIFLLWLSHLRATPVLVQNSSRI